MPSIRVRKETGLLLLDFTWRGRRYREQTAMPDNPTNRKRLNKVLERIQAEIAAVTYDY
jgi:integrase